MGNKPVRNVTFYGANLPLITWGLLRHTCVNHDDVIKLKHFPRYWPFLWGLHRSPVNSPHKGQWRGAFMFSLICARINGWVNNCEAGDFRRIRPHYGVTVMWSESPLVQFIAVTFSMASNFLNVWWLAVDYRKMHRDQNRYGFRICMYFSSW